MQTQLRLQILRAAARDRLFLKKCWRDIRAEDFPEKEEQVIVKTAVGFYEKYEEPIGAALRWEIEDEAIKAKLGSDGKKRLKELLDLVSGAKMELVSVQALEDRVKALRKRSFYEVELRKLIEAEEKGDLTPELLADISERASKELSNGYHVARDYFTDLERRIDQRHHYKHDRDFPLFLIPELDNRIRGIGRGEFGMFLAPPAGGKGLALLHMASAYALQGWNVLHFSLEDPDRLVGSRLDAALTGIPLNRLSKLPNKLRRRFRTVTESMRGKIKLINGTDEGWTVSMIEKTWENEKQHGFTADAIIIDYDDEIVCEKQFKGENVRRFEFAEIYRRLRKMASKFGIIVWTAGQTNQKAEGEWLITRKHFAEDYSKLRKVFMAIGIGRKPVEGEADTDHVRFLHILKHREDEGQFFVKIMSNYGEALFFDREATEKIRR